MEITIPVKNQLELFKSWLQFLNPILKLREETEIPVLASYILLAYNYRSYDPSNLSALLFSEDTRDSIRIKLGFSERSFSKSFSRLVEKGLIEMEHTTPDGIVLPRINPRVIPQDFKLNITFKVG